MHVPRACPGRAWRRGTFVPGHFGFCQDFIFLLSLCVSPTSALERLYHTLSVKMAIA